MGNRKLKITVLKKMFNPDLADEYREPNVAECPFVEGQEFSGDIYSQPEGFKCGWAWNDIYKLCLILWEGGTFSPWYMKDDKIIIGSCSDGIRPAIFKIERIDE